MKHNTIEGLIHYHEVYVTSVGLFISYIYFTDDLCKVSKSESVVQQLVQGHHRVFSTG